MFEAPIDNDEYLCIYHGNCADGFAAAWVVRKYAIKNQLIDRMSFYPGVYQKDPPNCIDKHVIIVDFSYKRPVMELIFSNCKSLTWIDHHKSAIEDMKGFPSSDDYHGDVYGAFLDMKHSGSMLTWMHFFGSETPPDLLRHIEDRDLWKFELPGTREIQATLFSYPYSFEIWDKLMRASIPHLIGEGISIERKHHKDIEELIEAAWRPMKIGDYWVPVLNVPYTMASDAGHRMCVMMELNEIMGYREFSQGIVGHFTGTYYDTKTTRNFSLRSLPASKVDVSAIAAEYGGGGHMNAAGFSVPRDHLLALA
jgi:oligoribonuclease NrnB/cAMP/cGMP phosphodiesterase (DHH superfamily)